METTELRGKYGIPNLSKIAKSCYLRSRVASNGIFQKSQSFVI